MVLAYICSQLTVRASGGFGCRQSDTKRQHRRPAPPWQALSEVNICAVVFNKLSGTSGTYRYETVGGGGVSVRAIIVLLALPVNKKPLAESSSMSYSVGHVWSSEPAAKGLSGRYEGKPRVRY